MAIKGHNCVLFHCSWLYCLRYTNDLLCKLLLFSVYFTTSGHVIKMFSSYGWVGLPQFCILMYYSLGVCKIHKIHGGGSKMTSLYVRATIISLYARALNINEVETLSVMTSSSETYQWATNSEADENCEHKHSDQFAMLSVWHSLAVGLQHKIIQS